MLKYLHQLVNKTSVRLQLSVTISLGVTLLLISFILLSVWIADRQLRELLLEQNIQVVESLAEKSRLSLLYMSPENASNAMHSTLAFPEVMSVSIYQADNKLLVSSGNVQLPENFDLQQLNKVTEPVLILETDEEWHFAMAVRLDRQSMDQQLFETEPADVENIYGYVYLLSNKSLIKKNHLKLLSSYGLVGGIISLLLLIVMNFFIRRLVGPLKEIAEAMYKTEHGDYVTNLQAEGSLEVSYITQTYNRMVSGLAERDLQLRDHNQHLAQQVIHDRLTGLMNRTGFEQEMQKLLQEAQNNEKHVLCYLDLDHFKIINDSCGHSAGDELLVQVGQMFATKLRHGADILARIGGDEFAIILRNCTLDKAEIIAQDICKQIAAFRFSCSAREFAVGVSIGLTDINDAAGKLQHIIARVDRACYVAKERGRGQVYVISGEDANSQISGQDTSLANRILQAIENNSFELFTQTIQPVLYRTQQTDKFYEFFLRLTDDRGGWLLPGKIISAARRYNLLTDLEKSIVTKSLQSIQLIREAGELDAKFSINLSVDSAAETSFQDYLQQAVLNSGVPAHCLCFDITEVDYSHPERISGFIDMIHAIGGKVALDDFVCSAVAIGHIRDLKIDYLKIDGYLFRDILSDPVNRSIVFSITEICHHLNIRCIAKQVEDSHSLDLLAELGLDYCQGYAIDQLRPLYDLLPNTLDGEAG